MIEQAIFAGGCFWCLEAIFAKHPGVDSVICGYTGGHTLSPDYTHVCEGTTGHAEAIRLTFNATHIDYSTLLRVFFAIHDPTSVNRQGNDIGSQYRSAIFYLNTTQQLLAENMVTALTKSGEFAKPIVTEVVPANQFYPAEAYHQHYYTTHPTAPYCQQVIAPKLRKLTQVMSIIVNPDHS